MMQEFVQEIQDMIGEQQSGIHTAFPGEIVSYDPGTGLASVQPTMKFRKPNSETMDYPEITGVPVMLPQVWNQQATIAYPVKEGDQCLIIVAEQSIDYWMYGQETETTLAHDMTDAICIPGLFSSANSVMQEACDNNAIIIDVKGEQRITVEPGDIIADVKGTSIKIEDGTITLTADTVKVEANVEVSGTVKTDSTIDASSDVTGGGISLMNHTHTGNLGAPTSPPV